MRKTLALLSFALLLPAVGCMSIKPVGPLWGKDNGNAPAKKPEKMSPSDFIDELKIGGPSTKTAGGVESPVPEGPPPPLPARSIGPDDVTADTRGEALRRLRGELDADRRSLDEMPNYPSVSRPQSGR